MKRVVLLAAVVVLLGGGRASAAVISVQDGSPAWPYQQWLDASQMPTYGGTVEIWEGTGRCVPDDVIACVVPTEPPRIYFNHTSRPALEVRLAIHHEIGHILDWTLLDDSERARIAALLHRSAWTGGSLENAGTPTGEAFASRYASCAAPRYKRHRRKLRWAYSRDLNVWIKARSFRTSCAEIERDVAF